MIYNELKGNIITAAKWSSITEIASKISSPIINMILARILMPEAFGVVATVSMIVSFADMLTDTGFQKYLVQYEFEDEEDIFKSSTVAFWTNFAISFLLWSIISLFSEQIAIMVGNPGLGSIIIISCIQLPLTSFSSIQMALYKRNFDFKTLFWARIITLLLPFFLTIPLALLGFSFWSIIIGTLCGHLINAAILTYKSKWKPKLFYNFNLLKKMLSYGIWSFFEGISIWLSTWIDTLIVGTYLASYYVGLYKTSLNMVNALLTIVTTSVTPILFSTLSRLQNDEKLFKTTFIRVQEVVAYMLFPIGFGLFLFSDIATGIMLGSKWSEASFIIGIWGLSSTIMIVFSGFNSECFRAKGLPQLSLYIQLFHLVFLVPTCIISLKFGFSAFVYSRALVRFQLMITSLIAMRLVLNISIREMRKVFKPLVISMFCGLLVFCLGKVFVSPVLRYLSVLIYTILFGILILIFAKDELREFVRLFGVKIQKATR